MSPQPSLLIDAMWERAHRFHPDAVELADRHYSRRKVGSPQFVAPGRNIVLLTPCRRAVWVTHWPKAELAMDGLDAWRCAMFRNEGAGLSSDLIRAAMTATADAWADRPRDGWLTFVDRTKVPSENPGYCFKQAGWELDRTWSHRRMVRLRADVDEKPRTCGWCGAPAVSFAKPAGSRSWRAWCERSDCKAVVLGFLTPRDSQERGVDG